MAVYNGERHLLQALESILDQTLRNYEFIIVDDASNDATPQILEAAKARDPRVRVIRNDTNIGPYPSGNRGLELAAAPIIARMDSDDISTPDRLERQVAFLDANPDHLLVGSSYRAIDDEGRTLYVKVKPMDDFAVRWIAQFRTPLDHSGVCFRACYPDGSPVRYDEGRPIAQDFDLFVRLLAAGKAAALAPVLLNYRVHPTNITSTRKTEQKLIVKEIALQMQARSLTSNIRDRIARLMDCYLLDRPASPDIVRQAVAAFDEILDGHMVEQRKRRAWLKRQSAGILADAILRRGAGSSNPLVLTAFVRHAWHYMPALAWRLLEDMNRLPSSWCSYPDPAGRLS